jgi:hypothetical protein
MEPKKLALCCPPLVSHFMFSLLATSAPAMVLPLLPPRPTIIMPSFGTLASVLKVYLDDVGVATNRPPSVDTEVDSYSYSDVMYSPSLLTSSELTEKPWEKR